MQRFRERVASLPLVWLFVFMSLFFGLFTWLLGPLLTGEALSGWSLLGHLVGGVVFGGLMTLFAGRQRKKIGKPSVAFALSRAMKSGAIPDDADTTQWRPIIVHLRKQYRFLRVASPITFTLAAALELFVAISQRLALFYVFAAVFAAALIWSLTLFSRDLARLDVLEAKLRSPDRLSSETSADLHP